MEQILAAIPWGTIGSNGLLALVIYLIIAGRIHSDREFQIILDDRDKWRDSALTLIQATLANTESAKVAAKVLDSIPQARQESDGK